jgi:hypothetical protein
MDDRFIPPCKDLFTFGLMPRPTWRSDGAAAALRASRSFSGWILIVKIWRDSEKKKKKNRTLRG